AYFALSLHDALPICLFQLGADASVHVLNELLHGGVAGAQETGAGDGVHIGAVVLGIAVNAIEQNVTEVFLAGLGQFFRKGNFVVQGGVNIAVLILEGDLIFDEFVQRSHIGNTHGGGEVLLHPGIGQFGGDGFVDVVQRGAENRILAGQIGAAVVLGEGDGHIEGFAGGVACDLIFKVINAAAAAELQVVALGAAAVELNPVDGANIVDVDGVAHGGGTVSDLVGGSKAGQDVGVDVIRNILVAYFAQRVINGDVGVIVGQGDVIQSGYVFQVAVFVKTVGVAELCQVIVGGIIRAFAGGGFRSSGFG